MGRFFWAVKRYPSADVSYSLQQWEYDMLHKWVLPFESRAHLSETIRSREADIRAQYDQIVRVIASRNWTVADVCQNYVPADMLAEIKRMHGQ